MINKPINKIPPALWLLILIVGLPQFSETVYTPALPDLAQDLRISEALAEYTLTIYLLGFAVGTLLWGKVSDRWGRRPCLLIGLLIYVIGCIGCFISDSISLLMISRFIQAFGGSTGSVLGQAIARDVFHGPERGRIYSVVGTALSFSPAIGPVLGGAIDQFFGWSPIFLFLIMAGCFVLGATYLKLSETHFPDPSSHMLVSKVFFQIIKDVRVLTFGFIVAGCNGIGFSYYAEGPFYLMELLGLSPSIYGMTFIGLALFGMLGGYISRKLHDSISSLAILRKGLWVIVVGGVFFIGGMSILNYFSVISLILICFTLCSIGVIFTGIGMTIPSALSLSLEHYKSSIGTASSLFGFYYYGLISLFTLGMGYFHNNTLFPMPLYFLIIGLLMLFLFMQVLWKQEEKPLKI